MRSFRSLRNIPVVVVALIEVVARSVHVFKNISSYVWLVSALRSDSHVQVCAILLPLHVVLHLVLHQWVHLHLAFIMMSLAFFKNFFALMTDIIDKTLMHCISWLKINLEIILLELGLASQFDCKTLDDEFFSKDKVWISTELEQDVLRQVLIADALQNVTLLLIRQLGFLRLVLDFQVFLLLLDVQNMLDLVRLFFRKIHFGVFFNRFCPRRLFFVELILE